MKRSFLRSLGLPGLLYVLAVQAAWAQTDKTKADGATRDLDTIVVTGTRVDGRTARNSDAPIDVISAADLLATGKANLLEALQNFLPSLNVPASVQPDLGSIVRGAQLRNLSPGYTLVLVDGKRRHTTAVINSDGFAGAVWTDLALIPAGSIDHIEVLRDGAAAIYGSDAIAGVINIILKKDTSGGQLSAEGGRSYRGDGSRGIYHASVAFNLADRGYLDLSAESAHQSLAVRTEPLLPTYYLYSGVAPDGSLVALQNVNTLRTGSTVNPAEASRDSHAWKNSGVPGYTTRSLAVNAGYDLTSRISLYGFATYSVRDASSPQNFRSPNTIFINNPKLLKIYPDGFTPTEETHEYDYSFTGGAKGRLGDDWQWDISSTYGKDHVKVYTRNSANYSLSYPGGATDFYDGSTSLGQWVNNLDLRRSFETGWFASPLQVSVGGEYLTERYRYEAGEPASYYGTGASSLVGFMPQDAANTRRHSRAVYVGASMQATDRWLVDIAGRYEDHSDSDNVLSGRFATRFSLTDTVALRGTVSNGFHAPSLITQSYTNTADHAGAVSRLVRPDSSIGEALGSRSLQPERSTNYSFGVTFDPTTKVHVSLDAYQVDVRGLIGISPSIGYNLNGSTVADANGNTLSAAQLNYVQQLLGGAGADYGAATAYSVKYFTNVGSLRSRGLDLVTEIIQDGRFGRWRWTLAANTNRSSLLHDASTPAALTNLPHIDLLSRSTRYDLLYRAPRNKQIGSVDWHKGAWSVNVRLSHYGPLPRLGSNDTTYSIRQTYIADASVGWDIGSQLNLRVGADNLFDKRPSKAPQHTRSANSRLQYAYAYNNSGPVGLLGGYYYSRLSYTF